MTMSRQFVEWTMILVLLAVREATGQELLPRSVRRGLLLQGEALASFEASWVKSSAIDTASNSLNVPIAATTSGDSTLTCQTESCHFIFQRNSCYLRSVISRADCDTSGRDATSASCIDILHETAWFEGSVHRRLVALSRLERRNLPNMDIVPVRDILQDGPGRVFHHDLFRSAGCWFPERANEMGQMPKSLILKMLEEGGELLNGNERMMLDGRTCIEIDIEHDDKTTRFFVAPALGFAVTKQEMFDTDGRTMLSAKCSDFSMYGGTGCWFPRNCEVAIFLCPVINNNVTFSPAYRERYAIDYLNFDDTPVRDLVWSGARTSFGR